MKPVYGIVVAGIVGIVFLFVQLKSNESAKTKELTIGMMSGWPPFMSITQQGQFEGFDVDVANELCARLNRPCKIVDMGALATLFVALEQKKIDMIFSGLDITKARREKLIMVPYNGEDVREYSLLFWNKIPEQVTSIDDLKTIDNPVVVVEPGDSPEKFLDGFSFITKKQISSIADQVLDLKYQKSLALFREPHVAKQLMKKNPELKSIPVPLPDEFQIYGMGIAIAKDNQSLGDEVSSAVLQMKQDGAMARFSSRWFAKEGSDE